MCTSDPAIHAIGEVAEYRCQTAGTTAAVVEQARQLAEYLRGNFHGCYRGPENSNVLKVAGISLAAIGQSEAGAGMREVVLDDPPSAFTTSA